MLGGTYTGQCRVLGGTYYGIYYEFSQGSYSCLERALGGEVVNVSACVVSAYLHACRMLLMFLFAWSYVYVRDTLIA